LGTNTDDDEISVFVQDIDARKPLSRRHLKKGKEVVRGQGSSSSSTPDRTDFGREQPSPGNIENDGRMLTNESDVDETLRQMNAAFIASLEGLGGRRERTGGRENESSRSSPKGTSDVRIHRLSSGLGSGGLVGYGGAGVPTTGGGGSSSGSAGSRASSRVGVEGEMGRGTRPTLLLARQFSRPDSASTSSVGGGQGSEEVIGRLELDDGQRQSRAR
jgi:hypothetical protein